MSGSAAPHEPAVVQLRAVGDADLAILLSFQDDPITAAMAAFPTRDATSFFAHWAAIRADPSVVARAIVVDGEVVGDIVSWLNAGVREVGYWIGRAYWGRGFATAALRLLIAELTDRPLIAHVALGNIGSRRVLEHCGFVVVGEEDAADGLRESILRLE